MIGRRALLAMTMVFSLAACSAPNAPAPGGETPNSSAATETPAAAQQEVVLYAPGAMASVTKQLAAQFAASGQGTLVVEVGHTPIQREQLAKGATPDVWIAANPVDMNTAAEHGDVVADRVGQLARTKLAIVVAPGNPGGVQSLADLAKPGTRLLLAAETLPIWTATAKTLEKVEATTPGFTKKLVANAVSREMGVQPIVSKVQMGEADAGIVFVTDVGSDAVGKGVTVVDIPDEVNTVIPLMIAPVTAGKNPAGADAFITWMTDAEGADVLREAGFLPPAAQ